MTGHRERGEHHLPAAARDAPGHLAAEPVLGLAGDLDPELARLLAEPPAPPSAAAAARPPTRPRRPAGPPAAPTTVISSRSSLISGGPVNQSPGIRPLNQPRSFSAAVPPCCSSCSHVMMITRLGSPARSAPPPCSGRTAGGRWRPGRDTPAALAGVSRPGAGHAAVRPVSRPGARDAAAIAGETRTAPAKPTRSRPGRPRRSRRAREPAPSGRSRGRWPRARCTSGRSGRCGRRAGRPGPQLAAAKCGPGPRLVRGDARHDHARLASDHCTRPEQSNTFGPAAAPHVRQADAG